MATYRDIDPSETDPQAPITAALMKALADNPVAIANGDAGALVQSGAWHPYNMVNVGDGATGTFYDFTVNGLQASITTPTFEDGYDYMVRWIGVSLSTSTNAIRINGANITATIAAGDAVTGILEILAPTLGNLPKYLTGHLRTSAGSGGIAAPSTSTSNPFIGTFHLGELANAVTSLTFTTAVAGNFDAGQMRLYRRRNFMFG